MRLQILALGVASAAHAQTSISLDGSLRAGSPTGPIAPVSPGIYEIRESAGTPSGDNLFHSFGDFDIGAGDRATFTGENEYERVIARVTGGEPSRIDGTLASTVMRSVADGIGADVYLLNPWGLLFGPSSSIDVPAGLHLSTAQQLHFEDGAVLDVTNDTPPVLSVLDPVAFGFLGGPPPNPDLEFDIEFGNPQTPNFVGTRPGQTFSIVGRDVRVLNRMFLTAQSGTLQVAALGDAAAQVPLDVAELETRSGDPARLGSVELSGRGQLTTLAFDSSADQGRIVIRAGRFAIAGAIVQAGGRGADGVAVDIETAGAVSLGANSTIATVNQGTQDAGAVRIRAGSLTLDGTNAVIRSQVAGDGVGGDVEVDAGSIRLRNNAQLEARSDSLGPPVSGAVGDIALVASGEIRVESGADVITRTNTLGPGGDISVRAGQFSVRDAAVSAESGVSAGGGSIAIDADEVEVRGGLAQINTLNRVAAAPEPIVPGGSIRIGSAAERASSVVILDGGLISTETSGAQPGGTIEIFAESLEVAGSGLDSLGEQRPSALQTFMSSQAETAAGGSMHLEVVHLRVGTSEGSETPGIIAAFVAQGARAPGGSIELDGGSVLLENGGQISTTTLGVGQAGSIDIDLAGGDFVARGSQVGGTLATSGVFARGGQGSSGDAGDIRISAGTIQVLDAAEISSRAIGSGNSGSITLEADRAIRIAGSAQNSLVTARGLIGRAGNVTLDAPAVELVDGGIADVSTSGGSAGGLLRVIADDLRVAGRSGTGVSSSLGAETTGAGVGLGIDVDVTGRVRIEQGGEINSISRLGGSTPGDVHIRAATIEFSEGSGLAQSEQGSEAAAGSITLEATRSIRIADGAELNVLSEAGKNAGTLRLDAPHIEILNSELKAEADAYGGIVEIESDFLLLEKSSIEAFSRGVGGEAGGLLVSAGVTLSGGNITIDGGAVILNAAHLTADGFGNANGGFVDITADPWLRSGDSAITASSEFGLDGFVLVNTPYGEVTGDLAALPETFLDASSLLQEPCLARDAASGSFAVRRAPRVAPPPDAPLTSEPLELQQCEAPPAP
ncbi:MAG TPA: filamentous hemagglutinin N-terminal domain-containing protein [Myxococcota bacterium]|nr:filamentous hemagglutinin N-terminal domain-containing protein [Myxococcota bacterium]